MKGVVLSAMDMHARLPLVTSLSGDDVTFKNLGVVSPLLDSESTTRRVSFVVGVTSHDLGGKAHLWTHA